jgi:acyl carrier protein
MTTNLKAIVQEKIKKRKKLNNDLKEMIIDKLNLDLKPQEIEDDAPLFGMGLGLDSIDALEIAVGVEEVFDVPINDNQMEVFRSVNTLADYIQSEKEQENA